MSTNEVFVEKINFLLKNKNQNFEIMKKPALEIVLADDEGRKMQEEPKYSSTSSPRPLETAKKAIQDLGSIQNSELTSKPNLGPDLRRREGSIYSGSSNMSRNSKISQLNFGTNLSTYSTNPPINKKNEKGRFVKEEHIVKTLYLRQMSPSASRFSSNRDEQSSRHSNDSTMDKFAFPINGNKDMNMMELIEVKREEAQMSGIRKRVCRKVYSILFNECKVGKSMARNLTLAVEARINHFFPHNSNAKLYIKVVKTLFKKIKVEFVSKFLDWHHRYQRIN